MDDDSPRICASLASYDPINGISIIYNSPAPPPLSKSQIDDCFRFTFGDVGTVSSSIGDEESLIPAQKERQIRTGTFEYNSVNMTIIGACIASPTSREQFCGLSFFIPKKSLFPSSDVIKALCDECSISIAQITSVITNKDKWETIIQGSIGEMRRIINSHISCCPNVYNIPNSDAYFYSAILSSHMQTQMTTIIEADSEKEAFSVFNFLSHFLLPYQLALSSPEMHDNPVRGLYLQCVKKRSTLPVDSLFAFKRPWTWVRVDDKIVFQSPSIATQASVAKEYTETVLMDLKSSEAEQTAKIAKFRKIYKSDLTQHFPEDWTTQFINKFCKANHLVQPFLCQCFMRNIMDKGILMIELIDHCLNSLDRYFLRKSEATEIAESLGITDKNELKAITALAQLYDQRTFRRMQRAKEVLNKLVSTV